nr:unnamed protein product [Digitaria exilis]
MADSARARASSSPGSRGHEQGETSGDGRESGCPRRDRGELESRGGDDAGESGREGGGGRRAEGGAAAAE